MWYLAEVTKGVEKSMSFATGRHVCFSKTAIAVRVIGAGGRMACLRVSAAKQHLKSCRDADGRLVPVKQQSQLERTWGRWEARRFDGYPRAVTA